MPLLVHMNTHAQTVGNEGRIGKLDYRIGNGKDGQGVYLTGAENPIPVEIVESPDFPLSPLFSNTLTTTLVQIKDEAPVTVNFMEASNINATDAFIQMFDVNGSQQVTLGTTLPTYSFFVPKGDATNRGGMDKQFTVSLSFVKGLIIAATTTPAGGSALTTPLYVNIGGR